MGSALYQKLFRGKKEDKDTRVNWNDNPIPEKDKVKHPQYKKAMALKKWGFGSVGAAKSFCNKNKEKK